MGDLLLKNEGHDGLNPDLKVFDDHVVVKSVRSGRFALLTSAFTIGTGMVFAVAGLYFFFAQNPDQFSQTPNIYFEVKAIGPEGHPLSGAKVKIANHELGVTDSFGEWRQFLRFKLGSSVSLSLSKSTEGAELFAVKNMVIPLKRPKAGDIEVRHTLQLDQKTSAKKVETPVAVAEQVDKVEDQAFAFNRISVEVLSQAIDIQKNPVGLDRQEYLTQKILPHFKDALIKSGLAIDPDSPWKVTMRHVSAGDGESLIMIENEVKGMNQPTSFLRNYLSDPKLLAGQIFDLLRLHTPRSYQVLREDRDWYVIQPTIARSFWRLSPQDRMTNAEGKLLTINAAPNIGSIERMLLVGENDPCSKQIDASGHCFVTRAMAWEVPPREGLVAQRLRITESLAQDTRIYVLGFEAKAMGDHLYTYWAKPEGKANLTLIQNGKVVLRTSLLNQGGRVAILPKTIQTVARR